MSKTSEIPLRESKPSNVDKRWVALHVATLIVISILLFYPIIRHPHWGTFDDANIILQLGRRIHANPDTYSYIFLSGPRRVGYFELLMFLWNSAPENPKFFYFFNHCVFSLTVILTYVNAVLLTRRPWISFAATSLMFSVPGIFEVIYTLDKQEIYLPLFLASGILLSILNFRFKTQWYQTIISAVLLFCLSSIAFSFKETSGLLVLFSTMLCATAWLNRDYNIENRIKQTILLGSILLPYAITLLSHGSEPTHQYVSLTFDPVKVITKIIGYAQLMPVYFVSCLICVAATVPSLLSKNKSEEQKSITLATALCVCCLVSPVALASFDTFDALLLYVWLPVYVFLLPAVAFSTSSICIRQNRSEVVATITLLAATAFLFPTEWIRGQFQLNMDELTHEVASVAASSCKTAQTQTIGALPVFTPFSLEVPENIEYYVRDQLKPGYYDIAKEKFSDNKFAMLNFLSAKVDNSEISKSKNGFLAQIDCFYHCPSNFTGWRGFQLLAGSTPYKSWVTRPLPQNGLLFVPYGDLPNTVAYRGWGLFGNSVQNVLYSFPQLKLAEICTLERTIKNIYGTRYKMGWKIFRILQAEPISLPDATSDSWLANGAKLFYNSSKNSIEFESTQPVADDWIVTNELGETQKFAPKTASDGRLHADIKLTDSRPGRRCLTFNSKNASEKIHCGSIKLTEKSW